MAHKWRVLVGDNREVLPLLPQGIFSSMVTDPPAGIGMDRRNGQGWDCFRRAANPNDVGRDSAFGRLSRVAPHSYGESDRGEFIAFMADVMSKAVPALRPGANCLVWALPRTSHWTAMGLEDAGFEIRDVITHLQAQGMPKSRALLKPSSEHWILCRTRGPLHELRIDDCRVPRPGEKMEIHSRSEKASKDSAARGIYGHDGPLDTHQKPGQEGGGFPANVIWSHHEDCTEAGCVEGCPSWDLGRAAKFYFAAKPNPVERTLGLLEGETMHPTVKSVSLMRYLVRLVTPKGGMVLDPFSGSGTTLAAASIEGCSSVGIEDHDPYAVLSRRRIPALLEKFAA
jgi:DNA modification methylase